MGSTALRVLTCRNALCSGMMSKVGRYHSTASSDDSGTYPQSTASINGYTDNLPVPGGNLQLSQRRAQAVEAWLVAHGVAASRLQAIGYGDANPFAPNTPSGQPLNRRVVVIIDPTVPA